MSRRRGTVETFDEAVGLGTVKTDDGNAYPFHCTQIAGGNRTIPVGITVEFTVVAGHMGRWEAAEIEPIGPVNAVSPTQPREQP